MLGVTAARLLQGVGYSKKVIEGKPVLGSTLQIMGVDLADGIISRKLGVDGPKRRALDSAVDGAIIGGALLATLYKRKELRIYTTALLARELFVGAGWVADLKGSKQVKKGDDYHKLASISVAAYGLAANQGNRKTAVMAAIPAIAINTQLAIDYWRGWKSPETNKPLKNNVQEVQGFYRPRQVINLLGNFRPQLDTGAAQEMGGALNGDRPYIDGTATEIFDIDAPKQ